MRYLPFYVVKDGEFLSLDKQWRNKWMYAMSFPDSDTAGRYADQYGGDVVYIEEDVWTDAVTVELEAKTKEQSLMTKMAFVAMADYLKNRRN